MILYDFSSALHRSLHTAIKHTNPHKQDGKYITGEFISVLIYRIVSEFIEFAKLYKKDYGDFIICLDDHSKPYWRKSIYFDYKSQRKVSRDASDVNFNEVYKHIDILIDVLKKFTPFKSIGVPGVEADDIIGLLTRRYAKFEKVLILSPDKDFKQLHSLGQIRQYSSLTNDWVVPDDVESWKLEHILCGDATDNVPRVVDFLNFTPEFLKYLRNHNMQYTELEWFDLPESQKSEIANDFRSYADDGIARLHEKPRFGMSFVKKYIAEYGSIDAWLDSNPLIRKTYDLNKKLVLDDYVPPQVEAAIIAEYTNPKNIVNYEKLKIYFDFYDLSNSCIPLFTELAQSSENIVSWDSKRVDFANAII